MLGSGVFGVWGVWDFGLRVYCLGAFWGLRFRVSIRFLCTGAGSGCSRDLMFSSLAFQA